MKSSYVERLEAFLFASRLLEKQCLKFKRNTTFKNKIRPTVPDFELARKPKKFKK